MLQERNALDERLDNLELNDSLGQNANTSENISDSSEQTFSSNDLAFYMKHISANRPLTKGEERELGLKIQNGDDEALKKLISANLKFVVSIAYKFRGSGLPMHELIGYGNLGLMEAAHRFDPLRGVKFISYAVWWIRQYIMQGVAEQAGNVRLPIKQVSNLFKINRTSNMLSVKHGRTPALDEIANELNMHGSEVTDILRASRPALSLSAPIKDSKTRTYGDELEAENSNVEDIVITADVERAVNDMLGDLDEREAKIIMLRYGFNDDKEYTLEDLGRVLGVSRERVRQLEARALNKLRKKAVTKDLREYLAS
ncbi:RNA polymerase sigma factor RpoD/SigA [Deferribacterales bacterium RsTz2092]|nr:RNA polymerase sigma factor [Deferribacterales bacterium]